MAKTAGRVPASRHSENTSLVDLADYDEAVTPRPQKTKPTAPGPHSNLAFRSTPDGVQAKFDAWQENHGDASFTASNPASSFQREHEDPFRGMSILSAPAAYQPSLAGLSTILGSEKEKEQEPEVIDLTAPGPKKSKKPTARPPVTPQKSRHVTGLNTPPPSNQSDQDVTRKRARSGTLTPTPTDRGGSSKRPKLDTEPKSSPNTEKQMNDTVASGSAPEDQRAAQPPHHTNGCERQPDPLINRHTVTIHNGHPEHDPSIFSIKPFQWNEWNEHDYFALSEFLMQGFNAEEFARQRTANSATGRVFTTEEAHYVMRAVVARPLRLMEQNTKRGKEGMMQLANYYKRFGAPIRMWAKGSQYQTRGEIAGIKDMSVHLMLETPSETDGSMASGETRAEIPITTLTNDDWWTLKDCASDNDIKVLRAWRNELNLPKLGPRATQAGASSGTA